MEDHFDKYFMKDEQETIQPSDPEKPKRTLVLTKLAIIKAANKKIAELKAKEIHQEKPRPDFETSSMNI
jgi:hypothetical protein